MSDHNIDAYLEEKGLNTKTISDAKQYLTDKFNANPRYSFNKADIMIDHSNAVMEFAIELAKEQAEADLLVVALGALYHDIGKTADESPEVLRDRHAQFNWDIANEFFDLIDLNTVQREKLRNILFENPDTYSNCIEQQIVKEADNLAFISDEILQTALYDWAENREVGGGKKEMQRKLDKGRKLNLNGSKQLADRHIETMRLRWALD